MNFNMFVLIYLNLYSNYINRRVFRTEDFPWLHQKMKTNNLCEIA